MLKLASLNKTYRQPDDDVRVLHDLDFELEAGKTAALLGESGSGKSTLLHLIAGLDKPDSGTITIDGQLTSSFGESEWNTLRRRTVSLVFQHYHLVPTLRVLDNILLQARLAGRVDVRRQAHLVERLGLVGLLKRFPHQLSGGQQQRVAVSRALASQPEIIFADEPTGNLDSTTGTEILAFMKQAVDVHGQTIVMVTHDPLAAAYADRVIFLADGKIVDDMRDPDAEMVIDHMKQLH